MTSAQLQAEQVRLAHRIAEQRRWIEEHGDSLSGYIARYGSAKVRDGIHGYVGDGGEAIYAADWAELDKLQREYAAVRAEQGVR